MTTANTNAGAATLFSGIANFSLNRMTTMPAMNSHERSATS